MCNNDVTPPRLPDMHRRPVPPRLPVGCLSAKRRRRCRRKAVIFCRPPPRPRPRVQSPNRGRQPLPPPPDDAALHPTPRRPAPSDARKPLPCTFCPASSTPPPPMLPYFLPHRRRVPGLLPPMPPGLPPPTRPSLILPLKHRSMPFAITLYFSTWHNRMDILQVRTKATLEIEFMTMAEVADISGGHHLHLLEMGVGQPAMKHATVVIV